MSARLRRGIDEGDWLRRYSTPIEETICYFHYDCDSFPVLPQGAAQKYSPSGEARPVPGLSFVYMLSAEEHVYREFSRQAEELKRELGRNGLGNVFAFLPPETHHVTIADIVTSPGSGVRDGIVDETRRLCGSLSERRLAQFNLVIENASICAGTSHVAWAYPHRQADLDAIIEIRRALKTLHKIGEGVFPGSADQFLFHITNAYLLRAIPDPGEYATLQSILRKRERHCFGTVLVKEIALYAFNDMQTWDRIVNLPLT